MDYIENFIGFNFASGIPDNNDNTHSYKKYVGIPHLTLTRRPKSTSRQQPRIIHLAEGTLAQLKPLLHLHGKDQEFERMRNTGSERVTVVFTSSGNSALEYEDIEVLGQALESLQVFNDSMAEHQELARNNDSSTTELDENRFRIELGRLSEFHHWIDTDRTNLSRWQGFIDDMLLDITSPEAQNARIAGESLYYAPLEPVIQPTIIEAR